VMCSMIGWISIRQLVIAEACCLCDICSICIRPFCGFCCCVLLQFLDRRWNGCRVDQPSGSNGVWTGYCRQWFWSDEYCWIRIVSFRLALHLSVFCRWWRKS
jgi:hypothetical protein